MRNLIQIRSIKISSLVACVVLASACGKTTDIARVRLDIGVPTEQGLKSINLMEDFSNLSQFEKAHLKKASCKQQNLVAAVQLDGDNKQLFSYPIEISSTAGIPTDAATVTQLFSTATLAKPIEFGVPKGANFEFAIVGFFLEPVDNNGDGVCDRTSDNLPPSGSNERTTYTAMGHGKAVVDNNTVLPVTVWTVAANANMGSPASATCTVSSTGEVLCPKNDFFKLYRIYTTTVTKMRVEYLFANNRPFRLVQTFTAAIANGTPGVYLPHLFPMEVNYEVSGATITQKIDSPTTTAVNNDIYRAFHAINL
jgi:hypothetical protein